MAVYSLKDHYRLQRHLSIAGFETQINSDMTSCAHNKCLYVSHPDNMRVHRYDPSNTLLCQGKVPGKPCGLSVTPTSCNILVTCQGPPNKLVELGSETGHYLREITLQADIEWPQHAVQLTTGQFVVCHGAEHDTSLYRVCVVDDAGRVARSYGGQRGHGIGQLNCPCHVAVDNDSQYIFVADHRNRVVSLRPTLELVRCVGGTPVSWSPLRLHFHHATRRLYVGHGILFNGRVAVIEM